MTAPQPDQPELLPCPFCGLPGRLHQWPVPDIGKKWEAWSVECSCEHHHNCPSGRHYLVGSAKAAAEAWNRRAATADLRRKVEDAEGKLCLSQMAFAGALNAIVKLRAELAALRAENERLKSGASEPSHAAEGTPLATSKGGIESTPDSNPREMKGYVCAKCGSQEPTHKCTGELNLTGLPNLEQHAGDCTFYAAMINGNPTDGICTCGYGAQLAFKADGDYSQLYSTERLAMMARQKAATPEPNQPKQEPWEELLPCPFCGEAAEYDLKRHYVNYRGDSDYAAVVYCSSCWACLDLCRDDTPGFSDEKRLRTVAEHWNRRCAHKWRGREKPLTPNLEQLAQETAEKCAKELMPPRSMWPTGQAPNDMLAAKMVAPYILRALEAAVKLWKENEAKLSVLLSDAEDENAIITLLHPVVGDEFADGDSYGVPGVVDVVEQALNRLRAREQRLREALKLTVAVICEPMAPHDQIERALDRARQALADAEKGES